MRTADPPPKQRNRGGRPRTVHMREGRNTWFSLNRSGCPWDRLPQDGLPQRTVYDSLAQWRDDGPWTKLVRVWREQPRVQAGRAPTPSALGIESQAVPPTEVGGPARGDDGGQKLNGRKRPRLVATLGGWRAVLMPSAGLDDGGAAPLLLGDVTPHAWPRLVTIVADQQSPNAALEAWRAEHRAGWHSEITARPEGTKGLTPLAKRWGMARTNAWHGRYRRHSKDDERRPASSTAMSHIRNIHLMLNRRCPGDRPVLHDRKQAA